jgi:predicted dehydrogenase
MAGRHRYAICGLSNRAVGMYATPILGTRAGSDEDYSGEAELVGILDIDQDRIRLFNQELGMDIPGFKPEEFDRMVAETHPDTVIVAGVDRTHAEHTIQALGHGLDVIVEKPMVVSCEQALAVFEAERESVGTVRVTHNSRYTPANRLIRRLIQEGRIGRITNVEFTWNLDTYHGASYFWRWNRDRRESGGLTITKSCHHFDLLNWWIGAAPQLVFAAGALNYYGAKSPHNPSLRDGVAYSVEEQRERSPYERYWRERRTSDDHLDLRGRLAHLPHDRLYPRERPIYLFDEEIDIEDTYSAVIVYRSGVSVSYSLNASSPWEGYVLGVNGTEGRLESTHYTSPSRCPFPTPPGQRVTVMPLFGEPESFEVEEGFGSHGGSDAALRRELFTGAPADDAALALPADTAQGAYAVAIGEAVWRSVRARRPVTVEELLPSSAIATPLP